MNSSNVRQRLGNQENGDVGTESLRSDSEGIWGHNVTGIGNDPIPGQQEYEQHLEANMTRESVTTKVLLNIVIDAARHVFLALILLDGSTEEQILAGLFYLLPGIAMVFWNVIRRLIYQRKLNFLLDILSILPAVGTPIRIWKTRQLWQSRETILISPKENGVMSRDTIKRLVLINAETMEFKKMEMCASFLDYIPMIFLQAYLLLGSVQPLQFHILADVSVITLLVCGIFQVEKSVLDYQNAKREFEQTLNFQAFCVSNGSMPILIFRFNNTVSEQRLRNIYLFRLACSGCYLRLSELCSMIRCEFKWVVSFSITFIVSIVIIKAYPELPQHVQHQML